MKFEGMHLKGHKNKFEMVRNLGLEWNFEEQLEWGW